MAIKENLERVHQMRFGYMHISKGTDDTGDNLILSWDVVPDCRREECPAATVCEYMNSKYLVGRCSIMHHYLKYVYMILYRNFERMTEFQCYLVGMQLLPLYRTLCRLKIEEIGIKEIVTTGAKGSLQVNPLYREMRETIKAISHAWKELDLVPKSGAKGALPNDDPFALKHGEEGYVAGLRNVEGKRTYETEDGEEIVIESVASGPQKPKLKIRKKENKNV